MVAIDPSIEERWSVEASFAGTFHRSMVSDWDADHDLDLLGLHRGFCE